MSAHTSRCKRPCCRRCWTRALHANATIEHPEISDNRQRRQSGFGNRSAVKYAMIIQIHHTAKSNSLTPIPRNPEKAMVFTKPGTLRIAPVPRGPREGGDHINVKDVE